jgi:hypothetical protein
MATTTTGIFFLAKNQATRAESVDGVFRLVLRVFDRQGPLKVEAYEVSWPGPAAAAWWQENGGIQPGQPLALELVNPRAMPGPRGAPETHATVARCARAPTSWEASAAERAPQDHAALR